MKKRRVLMKLCCFCDFLQICGEFGRSRFSRCALTAIEAVAELLRNQFLMDLARGGLIESLNWVEQAYGLILLSSVLGVRRWWCVACIDSQILAILKMIHIHNVYNSSSASYVFIDNSFMLSIIERQLQIDLKHVFLKNFNLHHSLWCDSSRFTQHTTTNQLLKLIEMTDLTLILSQNMIT